MTSQLKLKIAPNKAYAIMAKKKMICLHQAWKSNYP